MKHRHEVMVSLSNAALPELEVSVQFILGILLFVGVVGFIDSRVPWPKARVRETKE